MTQQELEQRLIALEKKISYPIEYNFQKTLEQVLFDRLNVKSLVAGLPIYTSARTDVPREGEIWILNGSVQFRVNGATYTLTQAVP